MNCILIFIHYAYYCFSYKWLKQHAKSELSIDYAYNKI